MYLSLSELLDCLKNNTSLAWDSNCSYTFTAVLHKKPLRCQLASADWLRDIFPPCWTLPNTALQDKHI